MSDKELKYSSECKAAGFEYIEKSSRKRYSVVKCMVCGGVGEYRRDHIRAGKVRCKECHEAKMKRECLSAGFVWLSKVDKCNSRCRCSVCGHEDTFRQDAMRDGKVRCSHCHEGKMINECLVQGFEWIKKVDGSNSLCRCLVCDHEDTFRQDAMRDGKVRCSHCHETKMKQECTAQGFGWIRKVDMYYSLCRCVTCGHEDTFQQSSMRRGEVKCSHCHETKMKQECTAQGFEWIRKVDKSNSLCRCLNCGHEDSYDQGNMRRGTVACSNCSPGHWNEPSNFYVVRISLGYDSLIKIGIANNPSLRYKQYGLPSNTFIEQLLTIPFDTKLDAIKYESKMKQLLEPYRIDPDVAKAVLSYSGFTECFDERSLDILI